MLETTQTGASGEFPITRNKALSMNLGVLWASWRLKRTVFKLARKKGFQIGKVHLVRLRAVELGNPEIYPRTIETMVEFIDSGFNIVGSFPYREVFDRL